MEVAILFSKWLKFQLERKKIDLRGWFIFLQGTLKGKQVTHFLSEKHLFALQSFQRGSLIFGGDLNYIADKTLDGTYSKTQSMSKWSSFRTQLHDLFYKYHLHDIWWADHTNVKDLMYFFPHHLVHYLTSPDLLFLVHNSQIGSRTLIDCSWVLGDIAFTEHTQNRQSWSLNKTLLLNPTLCMDLEQYIKLYFEENISLEVPMPVI